MTQGRIGRLLVLIFKFSNRIKSRSGHCRLRIPAYQVGCQLGVRLLFVKGDKVNHGGTGSQTTTQGSLSAVTPGRMIEHILWQHGIRKTDFFLQ